MSDKQLIRGTAILSASIFISKILGLIYIFPFTAIVGQGGLALYSYGYIPYTILLSLSTIGIPLAVSKFVAKYNALGDYKTGQRLFRSGLVVMSIMGFITFIILFLLAHPIAGLVVDPENLQGNSMDDVVFTIRMVSVALLIVPIMSLIRGYFQGFQSMGPTAVSQVIEQIIRIAFILVLTYLIIEVWNGELGTAVGFATFGAFVGAVGGLAVLLVYWAKRRQSIQQQVDESTAVSDKPLKELYKELLSYSVPIAIVGLAIPLYQLVDMLTFNQAMFSNGYDQQTAEMYFGAFTQAAHKLIMIPVAIATAMSLTILPTVTNAYTNKDDERVQRYITQTYQIILFLSIPAALGLMLLSDSVYGALFGVGHTELVIGSEMIRNYAPVAVLFCIFAVTSSLLQGINRQKYAVIALFSGLLFKAVFNYFFVLWFGAAGAPYATGTGYAVAVGVNIWAIGKFAPYKYNFLVKRLLLIGMFAAVMGAVVYGVRTGAEQFLTLDSRLNAGVILGASVLAGAAVYLFLGLRSGLAGQILGHRFRFLEKKKRAREEG